MTYEEYDINGYTFYTEAKDKNSDYQNSGITMESYTRDIKLRYYGRIVEILELDYSREKVPIFRVRWAKSVIKEDRGFTTDDTKQVCQVGTPSAECCNKSKFSPRGNSRFNIELLGNSRERSCRYSSSNLQNNFLVLCPQLHQVVVKHKV
jgi:hypothetical protein